MHIHHASQAHAMSQHFGLLIGNGLAYLPMFCACHSCGYMVTAFKWSCSCPNFIRNKTIISEVDFLVRGILILDICKLSSNIKNYTLLSSLKCVQHSKSMWLTYVCGHMSTLVGCSEPSRNLCLVSDK